MKNVFAYLSTFLVLVFSLSNCKHVGESETRAILRINDGATYFYKMAKDKDAICRYTCGSLTQFDTNSITKSCSSSPVYMTESQVMVKNYEAIKAQIESPKTVIYAGIKNTLEETLFFDAFNVIYEQSKNNPQLFSLGSPAEVCGVAATENTNNSNANGASENSKGIVLIAQPTAPDASVKYTSWYDFSTGITWHHYPSKVTYKVADKNCSSLGASLSSEVELKNAIANGLNKKLAFSADAYYWTKTGMPEARASRQYLKSLPEKNDSVSVIEHSVNVMKIINIAQSKVDNADATVKRTYAGTTTNGNYLYDKPSEPYEIVSSDIEHYYICRKK